jgi:hypothetical protein
MVTRMRWWLWAAVAAFNVGCAGGLTPAGAKVVEGELWDPAACRSLGKVGEPLRALEGPHEWNPVGTSPPVPATWVGLAAPFLRTATFGEEPPPPRMAESTRGEHVQQMNSTAALGGDYLWRGYAYRCGSEAEQRTRLVAALRNAPTAIGSFRLGMETSAAAAVCLSAGGSLEQPTRCVGGDPETRQTDWIERAGRVAAIRFISSPPEPTRYLDVVLAKRRELIDTYGPRTTSESRQPDACRNGHESDCVRLGKAAFHDRWLWADGHTVEFGSTTVDGRATVEAMYGAP